MQVDCCSLSIGGFILFSVLYPVVREVYRVVLSVVRQPPRQHYANFSHACGACGSTALGYDGYKDVWVCHCGHTSRVIR